MFPAIRFPSRDAVKRPAAGHWASNGKKPEPSRSSNTSVLRQKKIDRKAHPSSPPASPQTTISHPPRCPPAGAFVRRRPRRGCPARPPPPWSQPVWPALALLFGYSGRGGGRPRDGADLGARTAAAHRPPRRRWCGSVRAGLCSGREVRHPGAAGFSVRSEGPLRWRREGGAPIQRPE
jgi:hypothetical protein